MTGKLGSFHEAVMSKKGDRLRGKAEELRTNADNIRAEECRRISLELAAVAEELADQWEAMELTMAGYLGNALRPVTSKRRSSLRGRRPS